MELRRFFDIAHREHTFCKPVIVDKVDELIALLRLGHGDRALEIATGKGEFVIRLAEQYDIEGIGVDLSSYCVSDAKEKFRQRIANGRLSFVEMDGAVYEPKAKESFDLVARIGASWIYNGHRNTR